MSAPCSRSERPKAKTSPSLQQLRGLLLERLVGTHPDRSQPEDGHLPGVPVGQPVEAEDLVELAVAPGVPARVRPAIGSGRQQVGEEFFLLLEFDEIRVPDALVVIFFDFLPAFFFKEGDGFEHHLAGGFVGVEAGGALGVEKEHGLPRFCSGLGGEGRIGRVGNKFPACILSLFCCSTEDD